MLDLQEQYYYSIGLTNKKTCDRMIMIQIKNNSLFIFLFFLDVKAFPECQQLWCFCCSQRTVTSLKISVLGDFSPSLSTPEVLTLNIHLISWKRKKIGVFLSHFGS